MCILAFRSPQSFWLRGPVLWKTIFPWTGDGGMVWGWFKCISFIVSFIFNLIPPQIWQEVPVCSLEVGDSVLKDRPKTCTVWATPRTWCVCVKPQLVGMNPFTGVKWIKDLNQQKSQLGLVPQVSWWPYFQRHTVDLSQDLLQESNEGMVSQAFSQYSKIMAFISYEI